ncbi:MAG: MFS transporter [Chloroflexota bacterium]
MTPYLTLLRQNPGFRRLWLAQVISLLGDWFSTIVLSALIRDLTVGSGYEGLAISFFFVTQTFPPLLASPIAGWMVDQFDRKTLLVWSNWLRAIVVLGFLLVQSVDMLWLLYTLRVVQFALSSVFEPGQSAIVPSLVDTKDLTLANTLLSVTWSVMLAVGAVIGGIVGALFGLEVAIIVDAISFIIGGAILYSITVPERTDEKTTVTDDASEDRSFAEALRFFRRNPEMTAPMAVKFGGSIGNIDTVLTLYATSLFVLGDSGELSLGILYGAFGVGALIGPFVLNRFHEETLPGLSRMILIGFLWITLAWFGLGAAASLWMAAITMGFRAMGNSVNWVYSTTMIQKMVPDNYLGRAFAIDMGGFYLASGTSLLVHGWVIDAIGLDALRDVVYWTGAVSFIPLVAWAAYVYRQRRVVPQTVSGD